MYVILFILDTAQEPGNEANWQGSLGMRLTAENECCCFRAEDGRYCFGTQMEGIAFPALELYNR